ncbi:MAG: BrnA antitoxin family protein [Pyrinomonadaceae bacterium]
MKIEMSTTDEKIIEVTVTSAHVAEMRADGVPENEIPPAGTVKRFRPAQHILRDKVAILLDADIVNHFKKKAESEDSEFYQKQINQTLRRAIETE